MIHRFHFAISRPCPDSTLFDSLSRGRLPVVERGRGTPSSWTKTNGSVVCAFRFGIGPFLFALLIIAHVSTAAEEPVDDVKIEGKVQSPVPIEGKSQSPVPMEGDSLLHEAEELASPTSATINSVRNYHESSRLSLHITKRASLPASIPADLHTSIDMGLSHTVIEEDGFPLTEEQVGGEPLAYNAVEAVDGIAQAVAQNLGEEAEPMHNYNPTYNLSREEELDTNEFDQTGGAVVSHVMAATNDTEVDKLTVLRGAIKDLEHKIALQSSSHPGYAVDCKLLLILQTLEKRFSSPEGKRVLRAEAGKYHKGNIFETEKSFIHTFRQSLLLRMAPPTARKFHEHKNTELKS